MSLPTKGGNKLAYWLGAMRLPFLTATTFSALLGPAVAYSLTGRFNLFYFVLAFFGAGLANVGTNLANDYFDHTSRDDWVNKTPTQFSGGSRYIQEGKLSPRWYLAASYVAFACVGVIGLYLNWVTRGNVILYIGVIGVFLGYFYTASPLRIGYTALGELITGIGCGPLIVLGSYYVQAEELSLVPLLASVPVGLLVGLILYINEFQDYEADRKVEKRTLIVAMGKQKAMQVFPFLLAAYYLFVVLGVVLGYFPSWSLVVLLTVPIAVKAVVVGQRHYTKIKELLPANASVIALHAVTTLLFSASFLAGSWF